MIKGTKWESKKGIWINVDDESVATNPKPALKADSKTDVIKHYVSYIRKAKKGKDYDWSEYNAKRLVWDMGNQRGLSSVRNLISNFCKDGGYKMDVTLSSGPRTSKSKAEKKKEFDLLYKELNLSDLTSKV